MTTNRAGCPSEYSSASERPTNMTRNEKLSQGSPAIRTTEWDRTTATYHIGPLSRYDSRNPGSCPLEASAMYHSCYSNPYGETYPNRKQTTRLEAMWNAVDQTRDDELAIALVETERHLGFGKDEDQS